MVRQSKSVFAHRRATGFHLGIPRAWQIVATAQGALIIRLAADHVPWVEKVALKSQASAKQDKSLHAQLPGAVFQNPASPGENSGTTCLVGPQIIHMWRVDLKYSF